MEKITAVIYIEDKAHEAEAQQLSCRLQLPLVVNPKPYQMVLALTTSRLELRFQSEKMKPIYVDFLARQMSYRLLKNRGRSELIARAVGVKGNYFPSIVDTTAGFGQDAAVLAYLGCEVIMLERSPIICALLEDGLVRARKVNPDWIQRLTLHCMDAKRFLQEQSVKQEFFDVIYIDPMFPLRTKSALVKKEMRILKLIVGADEDSQDLFTLAKEVASKRIVVKRPLHAETIKDTPSVIFKGRACRFDVYLM